MKLALANLPLDGTIDGAAHGICESLASAARQGASILCTPENYLPGLRGVGEVVEAVTGPRLLGALADIERAVRRTGIGLVLGVEFPGPRGPMISAMVWDRDGTLLGRQDKVQLDPSEDGLFAAGLSRTIFEIDHVRFGVSICHEAWRYPETVRWAAGRGAQLVFVPHWSATTPSGRTPRRWADPANSFHEKAAMCRAAENHIYIAAVNYCRAASQTTSAVIKPDGSLLKRQPYGMPGLLIVSISPEQATGVYARRSRWNEGK